MTFNSLLSLLYIKMHTFFHSAAKNNKDELCFELWPFDSWSEFMEEAPDLRQETILIFRTVAAVENRSTIHNNSTWPPSVSQEHSIGR